MSKTQLMVSLVALLAAACGRSDGISSTDSDLPVDASQGSGNIPEAGDVSNPTGATAFDPRCWDATRGILVPDKTCTTGEDCKRVTEVSCGFAKVFAVAKTAVCQPYPAPPCVPLPADASPPYYWLAETGDTTENLDAIALRCLAGKCQAYVLP